MDIRGKLTVNSLEPHEALMKTLASLQGMDASNMGADFEDKLEELMAFTSGPGQRRRAPGPGPPRPHPSARPPRQPQRDDRGGRDTSRIRCVMCGKLGHLGAQCPSGFVETAKRPCFICHKTGHVGTNCPERGHQRSIKSVEQDDEHFSFSCLEYVDGEGHKRKPVLTNVTMGDYIVPVKNRFEAFPEACVSDSGVRANVSTTNSKTTTADMSVKSIMNTINADTNLNSYAF